MTDAPKCPTIQSRHTFCAMSAKDEYVATLYVERRHDALWITSLWVDGEFRKQGLATEMLTQAVDMFGQEDMYLQVAGYADRPLNDVDLIAFYSRFGFGRTEVPSVMKRTGESV